MKKLFTLAILSLIIISLIGGVSAVKEKSSIIGILKGKITKIPQTRIIEEQAEEKEMRVIADIVSKKDKEDFVLKGCKIVHELKDKTALSCPKEIVSTLNVREDKKYYLLDLKADLQINADNVWDWGYSGSGVTIAILDTGVDDGHIELSDSVIATRNFVGGISEDRDGHGTHVSGIITGNGVYNIENNSAKGVSPGADIMVGKVCGPTFCYDSDIEAGIEWAVGNGADIISMSLGGGDYTGYCDEDDLANKSNWAVDQGVVVIAAAGNDNAGVSAPACGSKVISVGATYYRNYTATFNWVGCTDTNPVEDQRVCWSNHGVALDFVAPGVSILSTYSCDVPGLDCDNYYYAYMSGTSMSAPHVAGMSALILQANPSLTPLQVKQVLIDTAIDLGDPGKDNYYGYGRIDGASIITSGGNVVPEFGLIIGVLTILSAMVVFFVIRRK